MLPFLSQIQNKYFQALITRYRNYRIDGLKNSASFPNELEKVFVQPLMILKEGTENFSIWDCLEKTRNEPAYRRMMIMGIPGVGKTKLLEYLTLEYAQNNQNKEHPKAPKFIPILLQLFQVSKFIISNTQPSLPEIAAQLITGESDSINLSKWLETNLLAGKCLVMFDGLDEVSNTIAKSKICKWLDTQMQAYPETPFIVTSRPLKNSNSQPLKEIKINLELLPFNQEQIEQFVYRHYLSQSAESKDIEDIKIDKVLKVIKFCPALTEMATNPLMLAAIANFLQNGGELPKKRAFFYSLICELCLLRRPLAKGIATAIKLKPEQKQYLLQVLALELMKRKHTEFTVDVAKEILDKEIEAFSKGNLQTEEFLKYIENMSGLLIEKEPGLYKFSHLCFLEYLAAVQVKETNTEQILIDNIDESWWSETIRLYAAIGDTNKLILAAWQKRNAYTMTLADDCWDEGNNVDPQLRNKLEQWLEAALESSDSEIAKMAAQVQLSRRLKYALVDD